MQAYLPGQAVFVRVPNPDGDARVKLVLCDMPEKLPMGRYVFKLRGGLFPVNIHSITVPVVIVMLRLIADSHDLFYPTWVDELAPSGAEVLESLASQAELPIGAAAIDGKVLLSARVPNVLRNFAARHLCKVAQCAENSPWDPDQFAAARSLIESQYHSPADLWEGLRAEV